jgi:hypothetical protein
VAAVLVIWVAVVRTMVPKRVNRKHADTVSKEFEYLTHRFDFSPEIDTWLGRKDAQKDLDELEWLLENRFSYLKRKGVDYRTALDSIRNSLGDGINRSDLGCQLTKFIALFGDGHSGVASSSVRLTSLCSEFLPFLVEESGERLVAFKADRSAFIDPDFPFLRRMDGVPITAWLEAASRYVAKGSPQFLRSRTIRNFRYVQCLHEELGLSGSKTIKIELESADALSSKQIEMPLMDKKTIYGFWPRPKTEIKSLKDVRVEKQILKGNIGYLRLALMLDGHEFLNDLVVAMQELRNTDGLIIDIRTNGGGSRSPLQTLFPFFMAQDDLPKVVNTAAYRLGVEDRKEAFEARYLYPASWPSWSDAERSAIIGFSTTFEPEWKLPENEFSEWHYFVISPSGGKEYYHYDKPVVILMERWNFSACDIFLGAFKGWPNVTLIGTPSGGGSGCKVNYRLGNSKIRVQLSSMASFQPNGKLYEGNGIQPDIYIEPVPTDFIGKTDTVLDAAIQTISRKSEQVRPDVNLIARRNWFDSLSN